MMEGASRQQVLSSKSSWQAWWPVWLYVVLALLCLHPAVNAGMALGLGLVLGVGFGMPLPARLRPFSKYLLQGSIVALGFALRPEAVVTAGAKGLVLTFFTIAVTFVVGWGLARWWRLEGNVPLLIMTGTSICGGSAIAAAGPVLGASPQEMAVALAAVVILNAAALLVFPWIGHLCHMSPEVFGAWAAIGIHDTSSVVGAASAFADAALPVALTIKLTRALWIVPVSLALSFWVARRERQPQDTEAAKAKPRVPLFILLFMVAVAIRAVGPEWPQLYANLEVGGRAALTPAIFLIGAQTTRMAVRQTGVRSFGMALVLWLVLSGVGWWIVSP